MGAYFMEASQINYRGGDHKMSVEEAIKGLGKSVVSYSTDEFDTNKQWIDGRTIYGKVFAFERISNTVIETGLTNIEVIGISGVATVTSGTSGNEKTTVSNLDKANQGTPNVAGCAQFFISDNTNTYPANSIVLTGGTALANATGYVLLEYVKTPVTP